MTRGYLGSEEVLTSVAKQEIIPDSPENWTHGYSVKKLSIVNDSDCTILINGTDKIFLRANQGFSSDRDDAPIKSLKMLEEGILFNWAGAL